MRTAGESLFPHRLGLLLLVALALSLIAGSVRAGQPDLRVLVDASLAMQRSDPQGERLSALEALLQTLPDGARAGVWLYADRAEAVVPHAVVSPEWRQGARTALAAVGDQPMGERRDIAAALRAALHDLDRLEAQSRVRLLLLADGRPDLAHSPVLSAGAVRELLEQLAPQLQQAGVQVYAIALSGKADNSFLETLARRTGGTATRIDELSGLGPAYLEVFNRALQLPGLPLTEGVFKVDAGVERLTLLLPGAPRDGELLRGPQPRSANPSAFGEAREVYRGAGLTVLEVQHPAPGIWAVDATGIENPQVTIQSSLQIEAATRPPRRAQSGERVGLVVQLSDAMLSAAEGPDTVLRVVIGVEGPGNYSQRIEAELSQTGTSGEYTVPLPGLGKSGEYRLQVDAQYGKLQRRKLVYLDLVPPGGEATLVTRSEIAGQDSFRLPLISLASVLGFALAVLWWVLRRRKKRKLEIWQKRAEQLRANGDSGLFRAPSGSEVQAGSSLESGPASK